MPAVHTFILAGGKGEKLYPLTRFRAKAVLPFCGNYRLIDFTLLNCIHSGIDHVDLLTRNECVPLNLHPKPRLHRLHRKFLDRLEGPRWVSSLHSPGYLGTADAIRRNLSRIRPDARDVLVLASDHAYKMDYRGILESHRRSGASVTVGGTRMDWTRAHRFGVFEVNSRARVLRFHEKPRSLDNRMTQTPNALVSMGIYVFDADFLRTALSRTAGNDLGRDVLPKAVTARKVFVHEVCSANGNGTFWETVDTIDSYWKAQIQIVERLKIRHPQSGRNSLRIGALQAARSRIYGKVFRSVVGPGALICSGAEVYDSVLLDSSMVGPGAQLRRCIVDQGAAVRAFSEVGSMNGDEKHPGHFVSPGGVVVVSNPNWPPVQRRPRPAAGLVSGV